MTDAVQEAPVETKVDGMAEEAESNSQPVGELTGLRWGLRVCGATLGLIGAATLSVAHAANVGWPFHFLNGLVFLGMILMAWAFAAVSRRTHIGQERRHQDRLFMRSIQLQDMAMRDELTELFNRRFFFERLQQELAQASEFGHQLAVLIMDVDGLKKINDAFGHSVGDTALVSLAKLIVKCTRTADIAARLGGDEFGLIMPDADKRTALAVVERLSQALEVTPIYEPDGQSLKLTVSVGISGFPWGGHTVDELMRKADTYLYAAKGPRPGQGDTQSALAGGGLAE